MSNAEMHAHKLKLQRNIDRAYRAHKLVCLIAQEMGPHYTSSEAIVMLSNVHTYLKELEEIKELADES